MKTITPPKRIKMGKPWVEIHEFWCNHYCGNPIMLTKEGPHRWGGQVNSADGRYLLFCGSVEATTRAQAVRAMLKSARLMA